MRGQIQSEDIQDRERAFNEASTYLQGAPVYGKPNAQELPNYAIQPPNVQGAYAAKYDADVNMWNAKQQSNASIWNGAASIGSAAASNLWMLSSKELKNELGGAESYLRAARQAAA